MMVTVSTGNAYAVTLGNNIYSSVTINDFGAIGDGSLHTLHEWLEGGAHDKGYSSLADIQKDYAHATSLDNSIDAIALGAAYDAMEEHGSLHFEEGNTYIFNEVLRLEAKSFDAHMQGATIKMAANSAYGALDIYANGNEVDAINWHGGTFDGNKHENDYMGSNRENTVFVPLADGGVAEDNYNAWLNIANNGGNLLAIRNVENVNVDGVTIRDNIEDGVVLYNVENGLIQNSRGEGGVDLHWQDLGREYGHGMQAAYFKADQRVDLETGYSGGVFHVDNSHMSGGSMGVFMFSTTEEKNVGLVDVPYSVEDFYSGGVPKDSHIIISNSSAHNLAMLGAGVEHAAKIEITNSQFTQDEGYFDSGIWIGNGTKYALIKDVDVIGSSINFNEAANLVDGRVIDSTVINTIHDEGFTINGATHVIGSHVQAGQQAGIKADYVEDTTLSGFSDHGIVAYEGIKNVVVDNAAHGASGTAIANVHGIDIEGATITHVDIGIHARSGDITISDSVIEHTGRNAVSIDQSGKVDVLTIESSTFKEYGTSESGAGFEAAIGGRAHAPVAQLDALHISSDTVFESSQGHRGVADIHTLKPVYFGDDDTHGSNASDLIEGTDHADMIHAHEAEDTVDSGYGNDEIYGGSGNDTLAGGEGDDVLFGEAGDDVLRGDLNLMHGQGHLSGGNDTLHGGDGNDRIGGKGGDDVLYGDNGRDTLYGDNGNDTLIGGAGDDILQGQKGADTFYFTGTFGHDIIRDFSFNEDMLLFDWSMEQQIGVTYDNGTSVISFYRTEESSITITGSDLSNIDISNWASFEGFSA